jgi:hypothetical protein
MISLVTQLPLQATVSNLWHPNSQNWNVDLIANIFYDQAVQAITAVHMVDNNQ